MRLLLLLISVLLLTSCDEVSRVNFAQPFPASVPNLRIFPARHQGRYVMPTDSTRQLLVTPTIIWSETMWTFTSTQQKLDSAGLITASYPLGVWHPATDGRYRVRAGAADTLCLDKWLCDTLCALTPDFKGRVRWYQGAYYLNQPVHEEKWSVERLVLNGRDLSWQRFGNDTLRLAVLPVGVVRRVGANDDARWVLTAKTRRQEQQIARYDGLWAPHRDMVRQ